MTGLSSGRRAAVLLPVGPAQDQVDAPHADADHAGVDLYGEIKIDPAKLKRREAWRVNRAKMLAV